MFGIDHELLVFVHQYNIHSRGWIPPGGLVLMIPDFGYQISDLETRYRFGNHFLIWTYGLKHFSIWMHASKSRNVSKSQIWKHLKGMRRT